MKNRFLFLLTGLCCYVNVQAGIVHQALYLNRGLFTTVNGTTFPYLAFNNTASFSSGNHVIDLLPGDEVILKVINNDTAIHGFAIKGYPAINFTISPGDSVSDTLVFNEEALYIYYDSYRYPDFRYMGAAGMICVSNTPPSKKFYWNIKEHQTVYNEELANGNPVSWKNYDPDYFTINGLSHPDLQQDSTARVTAAVGDTVRIFMVNTGQSAHSIHFHGFHCKVLFSTQSYQNGWIKDTFPLKSMEGMVLEMIPDKTGEYSVHDHNLIAVSGGGIHPNGMFIIMKIQ